MENFEPLDFKKFNAVDGKANCMLFAFNKKKDPDKSIVDYKLTGFRTTPIKEIVEKAAMDFGSIVIKKISSIEECPADKYLIGFYLHYPKDEYNDDYDYHFIRRELDGTWVEKPNWYNEAGNADLDQLRIEFNMDPVLFVVQGVL